jgi:hypothetical protein
MSGDPISRLAYAASEIDRVFGPNYAKQHPEIVCSVMASAASDYLALTLARGLHDIASALVEDGAELESRGNLIRAPMGGVLR